MRTFVRPSCLQPTARLTPPSDLRGTVSAFALRTIVVTTSKTSVAICALVLGVITGLGRAADTPNFAREVLPILSNKCYVCHGPDTQKKDFLRLDSYEAATRDLGGYRAIDPEALEKSHLIERIYATDDPMPPRDAEQQLTIAEREILARWVKSGGKYERHWAFVAPVAPGVPKGEHDNPIDAFLADDLQTRSVAFAESADRRTLARRAALVLTGLPPEPEELKRFSRRYRRRGLRSIYCTPL